MFECLCTPKHIITCIITDTETRKFSLWKLWGGKTQCVCVLFLIWWQKMFCVITPDKKEEPYWLLTLFEIMQMRKWWENMTPVSLNSLHIKTYPRIILASHFDLWLSVSGGILITPGLWCHQFSFQFFIKYDVIIQSPWSREMWGHSQKLHNHSDFQKFYVQSKPRPCLKRISTF